MSTTSSIILAAGIAATVVLGVVMVALENRRNRRLREQFKKWDLGGLK